MSQSNDSRKRTPDPTETVGTYQRIRVIVFVFCAAMALLFVLLNALTS